MFNREGKLLVFEVFEVDRSLPKHLLVEDLEDDSDEARMSGRRSRGRRFRIANNSGELSSWPPEEALVVHQNLLQRVWTWLRGVTEPRQARPTMTIQEFFSAVKEGADDIRIVLTRTQGYESALQKAQQGGQTALRERLLSGMGAVRSETRLHALGLTKTISEETLVEFVKKCPKGLRLDWVKNFTRIIPDDVLAKKIKCDEDHIFDNYVVLHYDPDKKSWAETHEEVAARKDPILFGVLEGRRQLYYVGDWVDEYCDLTLDGIADVLGRRGEKDLDANSYLD